MPLHIEIQDIHRKPLIEFYKKRLSEIDEMIRHLQSEYEGIKENLYRLEGTDQKTQASIIGIEKGSEGKPVSLNGSKGYNKFGTWAQKIIFLMAREKRPLSTGEIADTIINEFEPELKSERIKVVASISSTLTNPKGRTMFFQTKNQFNRKAYAPI